MTEWYDGIVTGIKNALEAVFIKKSDIKDNLTTNDASKVLSAKQGKELNNKITTLNNRYDGVYCANSGSNTSKPFYRLFNITSVNTSSQSSKFIFEITSATSTQYAKIAVYLRRNTTTSGYMIVDVIDSTNFDLSNIFFAYRSIYLDVFYKVDSMNYYRVKIVDDHLREGTLTQFSPTEGNVEAYASVESAGTTLYGANYGSIVDGTVNYKILASEIKKIGGTSSQFLKADGSVDTVVDNLTTDSSTRALSAKQGKWLYDNKLQYANKIEYITSTHTSATNAWTGTSTTISSLYTGLVIFYRLNQDPQGSTVGNVTLNLTLKDGTTTGAKSVYFQASRLTDEYQKYSVIVMVWDGSNWNIINTTSAVNNLTTTSSTRALSATQGKWLYDNKASSNDSRLSDARRPLMTRINATSDDHKSLNDFTTAGFYYCGNDNTEAPYIKRTPLNDGDSTPYSTNSSFFMLVETWNNANYLKQTVTYYQTGDTYIRTRTSSSTWKAWKLQLSEGNYSNHVASKSHTHTKSQITDFPTSMTPTAHTNATASNVGQATASVFGHVKLTDTYASNEGAASTGIVPSSKALYQAYKATNSYITSVDDKYNKSSDVYIRIIRTKSDGSIYSNQNDLLDFEGTRVQVLQGDKLNVKVRHQDGTVISGAYVRIVLGTTVKEGYTNSAGMLNASDSIGLNNGVNGIAYAILKGTETYHKSTDLAFIEYQTSQ